MSEQDAKAKALEHAGLAEADVQFIFAHLDMDDGVQEWDIEFISGNTEYDYGINAATGDIISFDNEAEYRGTAQGGTAATASGDYIPAEDAKAKALADAGIVEADCVEMGVELEHDSNPVHYDVDFTSGGMEYSYMVDAVSGEIIAHSSEVDD